LQKVLDGQLTVGHTILIVQRVVALGIIATVIPVELTTDHFTICIDAVPSGMAHVVLGDHHTVAIHLHKEFELALVNLSAVADNGTDGLLIPGAEDLD